MAAYNIEFKPSVEKDFRPIPKAVASRVWEKIVALAEEPLLFTALTMWPARCSFSTSATGGKHTVSRDIKGFYADPHKTPR